jgi:hypothetical protein
MQSLAVVEDLDVAGDGFERGAQVADLGGQPGQGAGVGLADPVLADDGADLRVAVEGGPARSRVRRPRQR